VPLELGVAARVESREGPSVAMIVGLASAPAMVVAVRTKDLTRTIAEQMQSEPSPAVSFVLFLVRRNCSSLGSLLELNAILSASQYIAS